MRINKPKVRKPKIVKKAQSAANKAAKHLKRAAKGHVVINVRNASNDPIIVTASIGNERREVEPGDSGDIKKANIGDSVEVYVNRGVAGAKSWRRLLAQNRINLEYNGRSLKSV